MQNSLESVDPPPEIHEKVKPSLLSEARKQEEVLAYSDQMESDLENILHVIIASDPEITRAVVLLYNHEKEYLWVRAARVKEPHIHVNRRKTIRLGEGLLGWIAKTPRIASFSDLKDQKEKLVYDDGSVPIASLLVVPILNDRIFEGLVCIDSDRDHPFSRREETMVQLLTKEMVRVLQHYRGQKNLGEQAKVYATLLKITKDLGSRLDLAHRLESTISLAKEIIDYDTCFIFLTGGGERRMTVKAVKGYDPTIIDYNFPLSNGLLSLIVKNRQGLFFSHTSDRSIGVRLLPQGKKNKIFPDGSKIQIPDHSFLGLPMVIEDRVIGVVLFSSGKAGAFTTHNRRVLSILCNHVAISIAEAQAHAQLAQLAITDGLTGLLNHRLFQERLMEMFVRVSRHPEPFSLLMIDIDHFKKINDTFGHPAGDAVIKKVANILRKHARKVDLVARYGGEEFVVLLVKSEAKQAHRLAERIRKAVEKNPASWQKEKVPTTVSIGISSHPEDVRKQADLVANADRALYASKQGGRNRTTLFKDLPEELSEAG